MSVSKAQQRATSKYIKKNYDRIEIKIPKGQKDTIKAFAEKRGESLNAFISQAIKEKLERDTQQTASTDPAEND